MARGNTRKGKPKKEDRMAGMGRALLKSSAGGQRNRSMKNNSDPTVAYETPENETPMVSVLEMDDVSDFLQRAEMAQRQFSVEREQFVVVDSTASAVTATQLSPTEDCSLPFPQQVELSVPRRPHWTSDTTPEQLDRLEQEAFLSWRRRIALEEEALHQRSTNIHGTFTTATTTAITPFEKNLHVWKQLWRVLERCACLIQIVDARNPMFYYSADLAAYCQDELHKPMMLLLNKSDYLTNYQREAWDQYLNQRGLSHLFFSAFQEQEKLDSSPTPQQTTDILPTPPRTLESLLSSKEAHLFGSPYLLTRDELLNAMKMFADLHHCPTEPKYKDKVQFGMVGFPNVGKSSVINVLVGSSKHIHNNNLTRVAVAAQPGKTKHFQTVLIPDREDVMLCDCPGLVFPSLVSSTADLIVAGVYPIDQMRDAYITPTLSLLCRRIPRELWNLQYSMKLPIPSRQALKEMNWESTSSLPLPTPQQVLDTYCHARRMYASASGVPDHPRATRTIVKDYVKGTLLYCHPPPPLPSMDDNLKAKNVTLFLNETIARKLEMETKKMKENRMTASRSKLLSHLEASMTGTSKNDDHEEERRHTDGHDVEASPSISVAVDGNVAHADVDFFEEDVELLKTVKELNLVSTSGFKGKNEGAMKGKSGKREKINRRKLKNNSSMFVSSVIMAKNY